MIYSTAFLVYTETSAAAAATVVVVVAAVAGSSNTHASKVYGCKLIFVVYLGLGTEV